MPSLKKKVMEWTNITIFFLEDLHKKSLSYWVDLLMENLSTTELEAFLSDIPDFDYSKMEKTQVNVASLQKTPKKHVKQKTIKQSKQLVKPKTKKNRLANPKLHLLLDIPLEIKVEFGKTSIKLEEILKLGEGSIIELDKNADDPINIIVNQRPIAKGEVIVIDETFGVRLTNILNTEEQKDLLFQ